MFRNLRHLSFVVFRWVWLLYAIFIWALWLVSIPNFINQAASGTLPAAVSNGTPVAQMAVKNAAIWGVSLTTWAWINTAVTALCTLVFTGVGFIIWWRVRTAFGLLTAFVLLASGSSYMGVAIHSGDLPAAAAAVWELGAIIWPLFFLWLYLFPNGRAVPRRLLWIFVPLLSLFSLLFLFYLFTIFVDEGSPYNQLVNKLQPAFDFLILPLLLLVFSAQVYRYVWQSGTAERKQTKWFLFGLIVGFLPSILLDIFINYPTELDTITFMALPIGIGISILRYRLWDIDLIIRKTVQYGVLTAVLALVYFGTVILLQTLFGSFTNEQSPLIIVLSTLLIAALFNPLRRRIQGVIDSRFYRKKYNSQKVLAQYAQTTRDEVDMNALQAELLRVVQETMQPETVSIWLKR